MSRTYEQLSTDAARIRAGTCFGILLMCGLATGCGSQHDRVDDARTVPRPETSEDAVFQDAVGQLDWANLDETVARTIRSAADVVQAKPHSPDRWGHLGMLLLAHDRFQPSAKCFAVAARLNATEPRWPYFEGIALRALDPQAAARQLRRAVELFGPQTISPQLRFAELLLDLDQLDEAEETLAHVVKIDPENDDAHMALAQLYLLRDQPRACLDSLRRGSNQDKPARKRFLLAAEAYRRLGEMDEAVRQGELAQGASDFTSADPIYAQIVNLRMGLRSQLDRADALFVQGRVDDSIRLLEQVVKEYPDSEWARILLARGLIRVRRLQPAKVALRDALKLNPNSFEAHFRMAVALQIAGQYEQASDWYAKTVKLQPGCAVAYRNLAFCRSALEDIDAAEASLKMAVRVQPNYFDGHLALAEFYAKRGDRDSAQDALAAARRLQPNDPRVAEMTKTLKKNSQLAP